MTCFIAGWTDEILREGSARRRAAEYLANGLTMQGIPTEAAHAPTADLAARQLSVLMLRLSKDGGAHAEAATTKVAEVAQELGLKLLTVTAHTDPQQLAS